MYLDIVSITCSLKVHALSIVDASNIMHTNFSGAVVSLNTLQLVLVCSEMASLVAF